MVKATLHFVITIFQSKHNVTGVQEHLEAMSKTQNHLT